MISSHARNRTIIKYIKYQHGTSYTCNIRTSQSQKNWVTSEEVTHLGSKMMCRYVHCLLVCLFNNCHCQLTLWASSQHRKRSIRILER